MKFLLSIILLEVTGMSLILIAVRRFRYDYSILELISLSFFLGSAFAGLQFFVMSLAGIGFDPGNILILPAVFFIIIFSRYAFRGNRLYEILPWRGKCVASGKLEMILAAALCVQVLWTIFLVLPVPVHSHDAVANYALKAKMFYLEGGIPAGFFSWPETAVAHPDYPLLLPLVMTWIYEFTGFDHFTVNLMMPVIYVAFLGLFYALIRRSFNRPYSLLIVFLLGTIPQLADYATIIHADLVLTAFVTCAFLYFMLYARTRNRTQLVLSSVLFGLLFWVKNEAAVFICAYAVIFLVFCARAEKGVRKRAVTDMLMSLLIVAVIAFPWLSIKLSAAAANSDIDIAALTPARVWENVKDIPILLNLFQQEVFGPKKWNIFWVLVFASMIWRRKALREGENFYLVLFITLSAAGYFVGYMMTTGNNLFFYVNTTISRFMLHFAGLAMTLAAFLMWDDVRAISSFKVGKGEIKENVIPAEDKE
ncbi:MAG: glycosyltransferase family 39 protein [Candidatus Tantalella remota]|nr:glycosyltransferase family 39 protein [Candidatus Tantalella remota]